MTEHKLVDRISLGATGIQISPLGIGTWAWGDTWFWQYGKGGYSDADLEAAYQASLAYGISFFDTAEMYGRGRSERLLGQFARHAIDNAGALGWRLADSEVAALDAASTRVGK